MNRTELQSETLAKAATDAAFRQQLIQDPRAAIAEAFGLLLPSNVEISVIEESPAHLCFVLPPATSHELSEADLSDVSGGVWRGSKVGGPIWDDREPV